MDDLPWVYLAMGAQRGRGVKQRDGLADSPWPG
jgi:hypothetical protein